jgi:hypothetical protein
VSHSHDSMDASLTNVSSARGQKGERGSGSAGDSPGSNVLPVSEIPLHRVSSLRLHTERRLQ